MRRNTADAIPLSSHDRSDQLSGWKTDHELEPAPAEFRRPAPMRVDLHRTLPASPPELFELLFSDTGFQHEFLG